jgi:hypothetical protein
MNLNLIRYSQNAFQIKALLCLQSLLFRKTNINMAQRLMPVISAIGEVKIRRVGVCG